MESDSPPTVDGTASLVARLRAAGGAARRLVGITGPPGSGKTHLAAALASELAGGDPPIEAVSIPMDGFHLSDAVLAALGLADVKGHPDTFDVGGFVALLRRLRTETAEIVYAPSFDRRRELSLAGSIMVAPTVSLVLVEGNYLLHTDRWAAVAELLDEIWYLDVPVEVREQRLLDRHRDGHGPDAERWIERVDRPNAGLVELSRSRATLVVVPAPAPPSDRSRSV